MENTTWMSTKMFSSSMETQGNECCNKPHQTLHDWISLGSLRAGGTTLAQPLALTRVE